MVQKGAMVHTQVHAKRVKKKYPRIVEGIMHCDGLEEPCVFWHLWDGGTCQRLTKAWTKRSNVIITPLKGK